MCYALYILYYPNINVLACRITTEREGVTLCGVVYSQAETITVFFKNLHIK